MGRRPPCSKRCCRCRDEATIRQRCIEAVRRQVRKVSRRPAASAALAWRVRRIAGPPSPATGRG
eukprot:6173374-Pleurochrysis_carterae.AAC.1